MKKWILRASLAIVGIAIVYYFYPETWLPADTKIDKLVVIKSKRAMEAYSNGRVIKTYRISLGQNPLGDKVSEGDKRTPEGEYTINAKNRKSAFHKNLGVSYPNQTDLHEARERGVDAGGNIKIHGLKNGIGFIGKFHRLLNWTAGCIAVTDEEMDELYKKVEIGTPIIIKP